MTHWHRRSDFAGTSLADTKEDTDRKCKHCEAVLLPAIEYDICPHCAQPLEKNASVISMYQKVSLGEMQQPGGVGATQTTDLVSPDGHPGNPGESQDDLTDAGHNSFEQNVALETWVNVAVDMLNRGEPEEAILAQLSHDGCPDPKAVLKRAMEQPADQAPTGENGDPFEIPNAPAESVDGNQEDVHSQPPVMAGFLGDYRRIATSDQDIFITKPEGDTDTTDVLFTVETPAREGDEPDYQDPKGQNGEVTPEDWNNSGLTKDKYKVKDSSKTGRVINAQSDVWGQVFVRLALDGGGTMTVQPSQLEPVNNEPKSPVSEIQQFIDSMPEVEPTRPSILARLNNLAQVRRMVQANISKVGLTDSFRLSKFDHDAQYETLNLHQQLDETLSNNDQRYLASQPKFRIPVAPTVSDEFNSKLQENAAVFVSNLSPTVIADETQLVYAATRHAEKNGGDIPRFVEATRKYAKENK